jgi:hypothetical protein
MAGRRGGFRRFSDDTTALSEAVVQAVLGLLGAVAGVLLVLSASRHGLLRWGWLVALGGAWAGWSLSAVVRQVRRVRALRVAVPGVATVLAVHPRDSYADEWHFRQFVDVDLLVTLPGTEPRRLRERVALGDEQRAELVVGRDVAVDAHPSRPVVRIRWTPAEV